MMQESIITCDVLSKMFAEKWTELPSGLIGFESDSLEECVIKGGFELYKWVHTNFSNSYMEHSYEFLFSNCLLEYIWWTEDNPMTLRPCCLDRMSYKVIVKQNENVVRYVDWLLATGRAQALESEVIINLIQLLLEKNEKEDIRCLLYTVYLMDEEKQSKCIGSLLKQHRDNEELLTLMGQTGILDLPTGATQIWMLPSVESRRIDKYMYIMREDPMILLLKFCSRRIHTKEEVTEVFFEHLEIPDWIELSIARYLIQFPRDSPMKLVGSNLSKEFEYEHSDRVFREKVRLWLTYGYVYDVEECSNPLYIGTVNGVLSDLMCRIVTIPDKAYRIGIIIRCFLSNLDLSVFDNLSDPSSFEKSETLQLILDEIIRRPTTSELVKLADSILAYAVKKFGDEPEILNSNSKLAGPKTLKVVLKDMYCLQPNKEIMRKISVYAEENLEINKFLLIYSATEN